MKIKCTRILTGLILASLLILPTKVHSYSFEASARQREETMDRIIEELNLTSKQQEQIKQYRSQYHEQSSILQEKFFKRKQELSLELQKQNSRENRIKRIASQINRLQAEILDLKVERILSLRRILTPKQYQILQEKLNQSRHTK